VAAADQAAIDGVKSIKAGVRPRWSETVIPHFVYANHRFSSLGRTSQRGGLAIILIWYLLAAVMIQRVRDFSFILPTDEFRLLKECLPRHSIGYDALDLALPVADGKRAFTCSEKQLQNVIQSVTQKFPLGKVLATLIQQQWQPIAKSRNKKPKNPKKPKKR
jgi:hypothetical protein